jgi:hypothetical protein
VRKAAIASGATAIVARDAEGFSRATLPVHTPVELLAALGATKRRRGDV